VLLLVPTVSLLCGFASALLASSSAARCGFQTHVARGCDEPGHYGKTVSLKMTRSWSPAATIVPVKKSADILAFTSYLGATATQVTLLIAALHGLQLKVIPVLPTGSLFTLPSPPIINIPNLPTKLSLIGNRLSQVGEELALGSSLANLAVFFLFLFLAVRSRIFSPLDNSRPSTSNNDPVFKGRLRPWFQPPPIAFPFIWSTIAFLRAISTTIIFNTTGTLLCTPIFALALHLSIGDTWNTINNVERRMGTAAFTVPAVLGSAAYVYYSMAQINKVASWVIAPMVAWLSVATCLVFSIWRINYKLAGAPSLFPCKEEGPPSRWRIPFTSLSR